MKFLNCHTVHDQYEFERQEKVDHICSYSNENNLKLKLRVCWITSGGHNCCKCEKCIRTMFEIFTTGNDPKNYGFNYSASDLKNAHYIVLDSYNPSMAPMWEEIKTRVNLIPPSTVPKEILWVKNLDFIKERGKLNFHIRQKIKFISNLFFRIKKRIKRIVKN